MRHTPRLALIGVLAVFLAVGGCGSTRIVVVDGNGGAANAPPTTAVPGSGPASDEDAAAIAEVIQLAVGQDPDRDFAERMPYTEGAEDVEQTYDAVFDLIAEFDVDLEVGEITTNGDEASAVVDVVVDGASFAAGLPVTLVRVDGGWKVTRDGVCAVLSVGSPCPEADR
jgi:hypothetical protein